MSNKMKSTGPRTMKTPLEQAEFDLACEQALVFAITTGRSAPLADADYLAELAHEHGHVLADFLPSALWKLAVAGARVAALRGQVLS